ncbi:biopolymer transporter ExbD [Wenyingzhuangia sp. 2_MG-2023]|uniref:ExbD/TolR family protein n=1 Tax=Wenyingzhuangia sp. 2_MG-2023 TaxID=3062639 RepID=UPI0026E44643|nr:biopolymer transporter ExbD [Wenyingzhuangia sp. 2_MG-2023]MDO6739296.1 biopolymer transporter ExbD [Wenyingzhuangia sp. 2_MG-2023]MDO6803880.1 biopolymer transporter ExbD [Wenyingzhuangia sp. 1_MG-2023]
MNIRSRNKISADFNMSSMTDIVFLLLIFFMLASTLVTVNAIDVILPKAGGKTENKGVVAVSITNEGTYYVDADKIEFNQLENTLLSKFSSENKGKTLVIRGDQESAYKNIMQVIDIANRNKIKMILAVKGQ